MKAQIMEQINDFLKLYELPIKIILIVVGTIIIAGLLKRLYQKLIERSSKYDDGDLTTYRFLEHSITVIVYVVGFSYAIFQVPFLKPIAQSMLAGAGIIAIAVGFAAQQSLGNIISGVFIVISKPYRINDRISLNDATGLRGIVEDISLRHTVIRNFENQRIIIPNSVISNQILVNSNYEDPEICRLIDVGISYGSNVEVAKKIMAEEVENHPLNIDKRTPEDRENGNPRVLVRMISMLDSSVTLRAWAWASNPADAFTMNCEVLERIKARFEKEGIVIPFPQRTISYLEPEPKKVNAP